MIAHEFWPSNNPRLAGNCACGRPEDEHPKPTNRRRNLDFEREITREAARGVVDPTPLIEFGEMRSGGALASEYVPDPGLVVLGRDRIRDAKEEAADLRNHLIWALEEDPESEKAHDWFLALRHLTLLYDLLLDD